MASAEDMCRKSAIIVGLEDNEDVVNIVNTVADESGIKNALNVRRINDDENGQTQFLVTLNSVVHARKFLMCKQCSYKGQSLPISSRPCTEEDLAEAEGVGSPQVQPESEEGPVSPANPATYKEQSDIKSGQNPQNQQIENNQEQPQEQYLVNPKMPMPQLQMMQPSTNFQQGPRGQTPGRQQAHGGMHSLYNPGMPQPQHGPGMQPHLGQGMQYQHGPRNQPQHGQGNQPQYGQGNQPQYGQGNQPQYGPGNQPQHGQGNQPQHGQGNQPQHGQGNHPQYGQGNQPQYGPGMQPQQSHGIPQIHRGMQPRIGPVPNFGFNQEFQSLNDPQLGFRNQNHPGPRMPFQQQEPFQYQYYQPSRQSFPQAQQAPFNPGQFQNIPQFRGSQEGYQYQNQLGYPGFNPGFSNQQYVTPGSHQHHYTEQSQTRASEEKVQTSSDASVTQQRGSSPGSEDSKELNVVKSHVVKVDDLPGDVTEDAVKIYFENRRRSGGGSVKDVKLDRKRKSALVDFEDPEDAAKVVKKNHSINKKQVRVSLHDDDDEAEDEDEGNVCADEDKPSCTIEVRGFKKETTDDTFELYFENRRSGGSTVKSVDRRDDVVFITFETHEVAERVLNKNHEIDKKKLDVKLHKPKPCYKNRFLVSNLLMTTTKESLTHFMEARSGHEVTDVQYGDTAGIALVSFDKDIRDLKDLRDSCKKKPLAGRQVEISTVPIADSIVVTGLDPKTPCETVKYYFEGKRSGNVTDAEVEVTRNEEEGYRIVKFDDHKVVDAVLSKGKHVIEKRELTLSLYIDDLGICQSSDEDTWYKQPESFTLESFDRYKGMFLQKTKDQTLQVQLGKLYAELTWQTDESVCFKCNLTKDIEDAVKKSRAWRKDVEKCFNIQLDELKVEEVVTLTEIWEDVHKELKSFTGTDGCEMFTSPTKPKVVVVGKSQTVTQVITKVKTVVSSIEEEVNRKKQEVTEKVSSLKPLQLRLLLAIGFHEQAKKKFKDVKDVSINLKLNELIFIGQVTDVNLCKVEMYEKVNQFCSRNVMDMSKPRLSFLSQKEIRDFIVKKMKKINLYGVWESEVDNLLILATSDQDAEAVLSLLNEHVCEHIERLSPESFFLLESEKWTHLHKTLTSEHGNLASISSDRNRNIIIVATAPIIDGIKVKIQKFISENSVYNRILTFSKPVYRFMMMHVDNDIHRISLQISKHKGKIEKKKDSPVIIVYGCKEGLDEAVHELKMLCEKITQEKHTLVKDGIGKYIHSDRIRNIIKDTERTGRCVVELMYDMSEKIKIEGGLPEQSPSLPTRQGSVQYASCDIDSSRRIEVLMADMTKMNVDVIVNAANNRLDHVGGLARAISDKGGPSIQQESDKYTKKNKNLRAGDTVMTGAGRLPCKKVVHAVGPVWSGGKQREERDLKEAITASLERAEEGSFTSIVFPALSTGIFKYPVDLATRHIVEAVNMYFRSVKGSSLRVVYLVDIGQQAVEAFVTALKDVYYDKTVSTLSTSVSTSPKGRANRTFVEPAKDVTMQGRIETVLVKGEIAKQTVDVIVNSTSNNLDLTNGSVSKTILKAGGDSLQEELRTKFPNGIKSGEIAVTSSGNLNCQAVYHTCLSNWGDGQTQMLQKLVFDCLEKASNSGYSTIAFPALGSGVLGYPRDMVASTLYSTVNNFIKRNVSLTEVRFVVYPGDMATVKAFEQEDSNEKSMRSGGNSVPNKPAPAPKPKPKPKPKPRARFSETSDMAEFAHSTGRSFTIDVKQGEIDKEKADVLVNSTSPQLNLSSGAVSKALLKAGGDGLQKELNKKYKAGIKPCELAVTSGGNLHCKEIYHTCLSSYAGRDSTNDLYFLIDTCLTKASDAGHTSISFPVLGTGNLGYPTPIVADTMLRAIEGFQNKNNALQRVTVVVHPKNKEINGAFEDAKMHKPVSDVPFVPRGVPIQEDGMVEETGDMSIGRISVVVKSGNLVKEPADSIINSTNINLDLSKGGVSSSIMKEGGQSLKTKCDQKAAEMIQKGVVSTTATGLQCKYVIHVAAEYFGNNWKSVIAACLDEARALGDVKSVAFPILGTGVGHVTPQHMADMMATTISEFESQAGNVVEVRVVVFQHKMLDPFERQMKASIDTIGKPGLRTYRDTGILSQGSVDLYVFSDDKKHTEDAIETLKKKFDRELTTKEVNDEVISKLSDNQIKRLKKTFDVDLVVDRKKGQMKITGFADQSSEAKSEVINYLREIENKEKDSERATLLSRSVQWCYMEKDASGQEILQTFDPISNSAIEKAFERKKTNIKVNIPKGTLDINLSTCQGQLKKSKTTINILRRDLFKEAAASIFDPPPTWTAMPEDTNLMSCDVQLNGPEFKEVSDLFSQTIGAQPQILNVSRIQNRALYQQYTAKKKQIEKQNPAGTQNERRLWHGTSLDTIESINLHGYNRSYCGKNATYFGQGVYFAVNANYSAQQQYSRPDANGNQYMYLARVLTGVYAKGDGSMRTPPPKSKNTPTDLCDSVTNDVKNPQMFVVFNDTMAYPEYLVKFKS